MKRWLPIALACTALSACGSGSTKTVTVTTASIVSSSSNTTATTSSTSVSATSLTTSTATSATTTPTAPTLHLATFRSPSANIGCMIIGGFARCDIRQRSWSPPPRPHSCPTVVDFGQGLEVGASGPGRLVCAGDTVQDPSARPLPYGDDTLVAGYRCASSTAGMSCTRTATGHGFFISAQGYRVF